MLRPLISVLKVTRPTCSISNTSLNNKVQIKVVYDNKTPRRFDRDRLHRHMQKLDPK